jgi:basic amino acid/polyamine antiporter, APA family
LGTCLLFIFDKKHMNQPKKQGQLVPTLTLAAATTLVISSVIGSGVYKKVAPMSDAVQSPGLVLLCWFLAGLVSLFGALSNAELAGMFADSGGEYVYFRRIYGRFVAFLYGWGTFTAIKTAAISSLAYVFAQSFNALVTLPQLPESLAQVQVLGLTPLDNFGVKSLAIGLILVLTYINAHGLRGGEQISSWVTRLVIVGLAGIVLSGLIWGGGSWQNIEQNASGYVSRSWTDFDFIKGIFAAMLAAFWGYEGWNTVGFIGGEIKNPNRNLPIALAVGLGIIITSYMLVNFTYLFILPNDQFVQIYQSQNGIAAVAVVQHFAGAAGATLLSVLILFTTLGCTNATILMPPRIYYAMAKDGLFFKSAADVHPVYNTPHRALWMQGVWACVLVLSGSFDQLTDMMIFAAFFFYGATAVGVVLLRFRSPELPRPYRVWGYPVVPVVFIIFCLTLLIITPFNHPKESLAGILLVLTGVPFYLYWTRK